VLGARETPLYEAQSSDLMRSDSHVGLHPAAVRRGARSSGHETDGEERLALRLAKSVRILDDIQGLSGARTAQRAAEEPRRQASSYALSNWKALTRYCEDGDLEIDNNGAERSLRGIAVGRRNWMFYGSDNGGRTGGGPDQLHHHVQKTRHRSVRLSAPTSSNASAPIPAAGSKSCFPTNGLLRGGSPQPLERLLPGICSGARMTFFCPRYLGD